MRILILGRFRYSRMLGHIFSLAAELNRQDHRTAVIMTGCPEAYRDRLSRYRPLFPVFCEDRPEKILGLIRYYRPELLHLHDPSLTGLGRRLFRSWPVPCGITLHHGQRFPEAGPLLQPAPAFMITAHPDAGSIPAGLRRITHFIPEGIDLQAYRPRQKEGFKVALVLEEDSCTAEGAAALLKAAALADLEIELLSPQPFPLLRGRFHGWPLDCPAVLGGTQITVGCRRGLLEGMACGNAALIMGQSYGGAPSLQQHPPAVLFPDLSGKSEEPPCYRSIFLDLASLLRDRPLLESLQLQNRRFVRENCDLKLIAEQTLRLYHRAVGR